MHRDKVRHENSKNDMTQASLFSFGFFQKPSDGVILVVVGAFDQEVYLCANGQLTGLSGQSTPYWASICIRCSIIGPRCFSARLTYLGSVDTNRPTRLEFKGTSAFESNISQRAREGHSRLQEFRCEVDRNGRLHDVDCERHRHVQEI
jgi:hypothetical protein